MNARLASLALGSAIALACSSPAEPPASVAPPPPPSTAAPEPVPMRASWLYEIHTDTQSSYVFAALDPGCPLHEAFPPDYMVLFRFARQVVVSDAQTAEEAHASLLSSGIDRSGSLARALGPERFARLASAVDELVPTEALPFVRPMWALMVLAIALGADAYGVTATDGRLSPTHDAVSRRRMSGAPVIGLYDHAAIDRTIAAYAPVSLDALTATLDHLDDERAAGRAVLAAYRSGDEAALLAAGDVVTPGTERAAATGATLDGQLLEAYLAVIETELRAGNALVLLSHRVVLGEHGLIARLRADGFDVSRISVPAPP